MAEAYLATRISPHLARTPDGFLLCKDVVIARSGPLEYLAHELEIPGGAQRVTVHRPVDEVTSRNFLASAEGAVVTDSHPGRFVDAKNFQVYSRGHAQNVRVGPRDEHGNTTAIADLFINDIGLAERVESGTVRDVSIGYDLDIAKDGNRWIQKNLRVNHIAVVPRGRAGSAKIMDSAPHLNFAERAALYLGQNPSAVVLPTTGVRTMTDSYEDDLIVTGDTSPKEALRMLRKLRTEISTRGTDMQKMAWNALYAAIRDGETPELAITRLQDHFRPGSDVTLGESSEDARRRVADDLVAAASAYLGQDINEVAAHRRSERLAAADSEPQERTVAEDFVARAERAGEQMRNRRR